MRRFSQRNQLVTLSDINITPLLDLAFVLLIIFVIISPGIRSKHEQGMELNLPKGGSTDRKVDDRDVMVVSVSRKGDYMLGSRHLNVSQIENILVNARKKKPNLVVNIRADEDGAYRHVFKVLDICQQNRIAANLRGESEK